VFGIFDEWKWNGGVAMSVRPGGGFDRVPTPTNKRNAPVVGETRFLRLSTTDLRPSVKIKTVSW
jgi:hypothetical protein